MRSFQQVLVFLFATLFAFAHAQSESISYDATVYITSTVYRVNTVRLSASPSGSVVNQTSTIYPTSVGTIVTPSHAANGTTPGYTSGSATPTTSGTPGEFTGAASRMNVNALVAALAAGAGYMAL